MFTYVRDIANANVDPFIVDWPIENDTIKFGEVLRLGLDDTDDLNYAVSAEGAVGASGHRILGISQEGITSTLDRDDTTTWTVANFGKVLLNPFGVYEVNYSLEEADDLDVTSGSTTTAIYTCASAEGQPFLGGSWTYTRAGTNVGELDAIEDSSVSSTDCTIVYAHTLGTAMDNTSRIVIIYGRGQRIIGLGDVDIIQDPDADEDSVVSVQSNGIAVTIVENYIQTDAIRRRVLQKGPERGQATDVARTGLNTANVKFFSHLVFGGLSHVFADSTGITRGS